MNRSDNAWAGLLASQLIARLSLDVLSLAEPSPSLKVFAMYCKYS